MINLLFRDNFVLIRNVCQYKKTLFDTEFGFLSTWSKCPVCEIQLIGPRKLSLTFPFGGKTRNWLTPKVTSYSFEKPKLTFSSQLKILEDNNRFRGCRYVMSYDLVEGKGKLELYGMKILRYNHVLRQVLIHTTWNKLTIHFNFRFYVTCRQLSYCYNKKWCFILVAFLATMLTTAVIGVFEYDQVYTEFVPLMSSKPKISHGLNVNLALKDFLQK